MSVELWLLSNDLNISQTKQLSIMDLENFTALNLLLPVEYAQDKIWKECGGRVVNQVKAFFVREFGKNFNLKFSLFVVSCLSQITCNVFDSRLTVVASKFRDFRTPGKFSLQDIF